MSVAPNPADPRVRRTRQLLQQAFRELLERQSFESITVQDIAERATVNRATFYAHFEDKYALLDSMIHEQFRSALEQKLPAAPTLSEETVYALAVLIFDLLGTVDGHCGPTDHYVKPLFEAAVQREVKLALLDWIARTEMTASPAQSRAGADALRDSVATVMSWALFGAARQWAQDPQPQPIAQAAHQAVETLMSGVSRTLGLPAPERR
ncbi:MAG TPA: TetR family transcriptional regulator [Ktedonobacterales bacterium]